MITGDDVESEPFCPFGSPLFKFGYCDVAYSDRCYSCEESRNAYLAKLNIKEDQL